MNAAIIEAKKALKINEVPIGAVLVDNQTNKIIFRNYNKINTLNNAIKHCEINLINDACETLKQKYLENMTMFVTLEPCSMCTSAISEVHIGALYFGAYDEKNGGIEKIRTTFQRNNIFMPNIYGGILEDDCSILLKKFFSNKR